MLDTIGWLLVKKGDLAKGLAYLRDAHSRAATRLDVRYHIAVALLGLDRPIEARDELRAALKPGRNFRGRAEAESLLLGLD